MEINITNEELSRVMYALALLVTRYEIEIQTFYTDNNSSAAAFYELFFYYPTLANYNSLREKTKWGEPREAKQFITN